MVKVYKLKVDREYPEERFVREEEYEKLRSKYDELKRDCDKVVQQRDNYKEMMEIEKDHLNREIYNWNNLYEENKTLKRQIVSSEKRKLKFE